MIFKGDDHRCHACDKQQKGRHQLKDTASGHRPLEFLTMLHQLLEPVIQIVKFLGRFDTDFGGGRNIQFTTFLLKNTAALILYIWRLKKV